MELMNEAATNIGESAPFSDITINQWREAEKRSEWHFCLRLS